MNKPRPVQVIAVSSGKGGVGKSNIAVNLGIALAERGRRVLVLDAGLGLGNLDVLLGLTVHHNLQHVLDGQCSLEDILVDRKSTRLNSSHVRISYAVFCLK